MGPKLFEYAEFNDAVRFFCFRPETPFLGKFSPKNQICQFKLKFGTKTNSNIQNSKVVFTFSVLNRKYTFWANLVQKIKIVSLNWNLVPRLIRIYNIQWWYHFFLFWSGNNLFGQVWSKKSKLSDSAQI